MSVYEKPVVGKVDLESENCGCTIFVEFGKEVGVQDGRPERPPEEPKEDPCHETEPAPEPQPQPTGPENTLTNKFLLIDEHGVQITPFENTGIPASDPITIYAPVDVQGVSADVDLSGASAGVSLADLSVTVLGLQIV